MRCCLRRRKGEVVSDFLMVPVLPSPSCVSHQLFTTEMYGALRARNFRGVSIRCVPPPFFSPLSSLASNTCLLNNKRNHACCSSYSYLHGGFRLCFWYVLIDITHELSRRKEFFKKEKSTIGDA